MSFCQLEDDTSSRELIIFPRTFAELPNIWVQDHTVLVRAKVSTRDGQAKMICDKAWLITDENIQSLQKELKEVDFLLLQVSK